MQSIRNRIAVIEDEEDIANLFGELIRGEGYEVDIFTNSVIAYEKISSLHSRYSLVVTDNRMPGLTGFELAKNLYKIDREIQTVFISCLDINWANGIMDHIGIKFDFYRKPITSQQLREIVNNKMKKGK